MLGHDEDDWINDDPFLFWNYRKDDRVAFYVRLKGEKLPFGVYLAENAWDLFQTIDEVVSPYECECTVMAPGEAFFLDEEEKPKISEFAESRLSRLSWRPVDTSAYEQHWAGKERDARRKKITNLEQQASELEKIFKGLKRTANDRFGGHRKRSRKDAGSVEEVRSRENHSR